MLSFKSADNKLWLGHTLRKGHDDLTNQAWNPYHGRRKPGRPKTYWRRELLIERKEEKIKKIKSVASKRDQSKEHYAWPTFWRELKSNDDDYNFVTKIRFNFASNWCNFRFKFLRGGKISNYLQFHYKMPLLKLEASVVFYFWQPFSS